MRFMKVHGEQAVLPSLKTIFMALMRRTIMQKLDADVYASFEDSVRRAAQFITVGKKGNDGYLQEQAGNLTAHI